MVKYVYLSENKLGEEQRLCIGLLMKECFGHVDPIEARDCFCAESFARILACSNGKLIGHLRLFKRRVEFEKREVILGGIGGVCVSESMRERGIATRLVRKGLQVLKHEKVDIACLNADLSRAGDKFYEKLGFTLMNRKISFEDIGGRLRYDDGTMFIPVCSKEIYQRIMDGKKTLHYGRGYW